MSYQKVTQNGTTIETINGEHYINGRHIEPGLPREYKTKLVAMFGIGITLGVLLGYYLGIAG